MCIMYPSVGVIGTAIPESTLVPQKSMVLFLGFEFFFLQESTLCIMCSVGVIIMIYLTELANLKTKKKKKQSNT